jgi:DNA-binding sugar fermentation-stimulating protein
MILFFSEKTVSELSQNKVQICFSSFVIQMEGVDICLPNKATDPDFSEVIEEAKKEGVEILYLRCRVKEDELYIDE